MGLFGNRDRDELKGRLDSTEAELDKARKELERERARADEARKTAKAAQDGLDALKAKLTEAETARDRALELKAKTDQAAKWLEDRYNQAMASAGTAGKAREEDAAKAVDAVAEAAQCRSESERLRGDNERLRGENERLRMDLDAARRDRSEQQRQRPSAPPAAPSTEDAARLRAEFDDVRRRLAETDEHLRVALRKAEHNRRAYIVTQMQLDLAEDRLHILTTGKPRPVFESPMGGPVERPVAEDVEGYTYADDGIVGTGEAEKPGAETPEESPDPKAPGDDAGRQGA